MNFITSLFVNQDFEYKFVFSQKKHKKGIYSST